MVSEPPTTTASPTAPPVPAPEAAPNLRVGKVSAGGVASLSPAAGASPVDSAFLRPKRLPLGSSARRLSYERRLRLWLAALAAPGLLFCSALVYQLTRSWGFALGAASALALAWSIAVLYLFDQLVRPLQTLSNVVAALREDDFSFRARGARRGDSLGDLALEINALASNLQSQRASARDALSLLDRVVSSMPSPVLAFGPERRLRLFNSAAERVFAISSRQALGRTSADLSLDAVLDLPDQAIFSASPAAQAPFAIQSATPSFAQGGTQAYRSPLTPPPSVPPTNAVSPPLDFYPSQEFPAASITTVRWSVRRSQFRLNGVPHTLLVLSDVAAALREEERRAWQRLIRVLSHEINNSLTPIKSIAGSLHERLKTLRATDADRDATAHFAASASLVSDTSRGLEIIEERAASLNRFLHAYQQLTRLPPPQLRHVSLTQLIAQVAALETRLTVTIQPGPAVALSADSDQLQQLLINLIRNAAEAALTVTVPAPLLSHAPAALEPMEQRGKGTSPEVYLDWTAGLHEVVIRIRDNGPGLTSAANLFVPFYTTKPSGTGIGLVLARQIAAAHHGSLDLTNREDGVAGCIALLRMPVDSQARPH